MTLNEGQSHPNWYENVELSGLYHHTKFERNQSVNVWKQANMKVFFKKWDNKSRFQMNDIKCVWGSSHQQVSGVDQILFKLIENFVW